MNSSNTSEAKRHPIQIAARRSGLSVDVLRVWEKRYGAVRPDRTGRGRRLYSDQDIQRLRLLQQATEAGRRIGDIANLPMAELDGMVQEDRHAVAARSGVLRLEPSARQHPQVTACLAAVKQLDGRRLKGVLDSAVVSLAPEALIEQVISPLMRRIGELWWLGKLSPSQEHLASAVVRGTLMEVMNATAPRGPAPILLVATPSGQHHEFGAMLAAAAGATHGWRVVYLGADLPGADIGAAARESGATAVAVSLVHPPDDPELGWELKLLRQALPPDVPVFVGGHAASSYAAVLEQIDAVALPDMRAFGSALDTLAQVPMNTTESAAPETTESRVTPGP